MNNELLKVINLNDYKKQKLNIKHNISNDKQMFNNDFYNILRGKKRKEKEK